METAIASAKMGLHVIKQEGVMALCKGMSVFSFKRMADWMTRYFFVVEVSMAPVWCVDQLPSDHAGAGIL